MQRAGKGIVGGGEEGTQGLPLWTIFGVRTFDTSSNHRQKERLNILLITWHLYTINVKKKKKNFQIQNIKR